MFTIFILMIFFEQFPIPLSNSIFLALYSVQPLILARLKWEFGEANSPPSNSILILGSIRPSPPSLFPFPIPLNLHWQIPEKEEAKHFDSFPHLKNSIQCKYWTRKNRREDGTKTPWSRIQPIHSLPNSTHFHVGIYFLALPVFFAYPSVYLPSHSHSIEFVQKNPTNPRKPPFLKRRK